MKKTFFLKLGLLFLNVSLAQEAQRYENNRGESHLCGSFQIEELAKDSIYQKWYNSNYAAFELSTKKRPWISNLNDTKVTIYLGTWCGDSKKWVPKFVKLWDELGLKRELLNFIALYDFYDGKYKQDPNGAEKNKDIHRVPTFIFKEKGKEIARIVESPHTDLETDVAQIALGYPPKPNYPGASRMITLLKTKSKQELKESDKNLNEVFRLVKGARELNTLGYVYLESNRIEEVLTTFYYNTRFFKYDPNVYDSYAEALVKAGQKETAIANYEKVLLLDRNNRHAREQINQLREQ